MKFLFAIMFFLIHIANTSACDTLIFKGQMSAYVHFNASNNLPCLIGGRYIPQLNTSKALPKSRLIDAEISVNISGNLESKPFYKFNTDGNIKSYRAWVRYSGNQFELRLGLQKINFGSAALLRPLMWFDQVDPRDPLQLTNGVWGLLGRYYFLNNTNLWLWSLWGNKGQKMWESSKTSQKYPEIGGRLQSPLLGGEAAFSYHFRVAKIKEFESPGFTFGEAAENRFGIDGKWDFGVGLWCEATWITINKNVGMLTNQQMINVGVDYTFAIGNGLNVILENLLFSSGHKPFTFNTNVWFTGLAGNYPAGIFDNLQAIVFYDWSDASFYNYLNWKKQFNKLDFNIMAYWNPKNYKMPSQGNTRVLYGGKGVQVMLVLNH